MPNDPPRLEAQSLVCVVDDEESVRRSLSRLFRSAGLAARTYASAADYLAAAIHSGPCCLVLDMNMPEMNGFDLQQALDGRAEQIIFLTGHGDVPMCARAMKSGAVDFLTKPADDEILLAAVHRALDRSRAAAVVWTEQCDARRKLAGLTPREAEVMQRVVSGMLNKQIAVDLGIAEKTIKIHRGRMMRKMGVVSVPDLVRLSIAAQPITAVEFS